MVDPFRPEKPRPGSWQLAQLVPGGRERRASKNSFFPSATSAGSSGGLPRGGTGSTFVRRAGTTGPRGRLGIFAAAHACSMVGLGAGLPFPQPASANNAKAAPVARRRPDAS